jgi:S-adenosylmethionine:tRNA ribosyltransferase-isomerase
VQGSVASPTAGLHFTKRVFRSLEGRGIKKSDLTLHVGAGTFQPVKSYDISDHQMHTEHFFAGRHLIEELIRSRNNIFAVGTTSVRALESLYWAGIKLMKKPDLQPGDLFLDQWEAYQLQGEAKRTEEILYFMLSWMEKHNTEQVMIPTRLLIIPGYKFRIIDGMITNFHLPMSTLLLLVSAWTGESWRRIYDYAISNRFRFLSYGDSCLLLK